MTNLFERTYERMQEDKTMTIKVYFKQRGSAEEKTVTVGEDFIQLCKNVTGAIVCLDKMANDAVKSGWLSCYKIEVEE